MGILLMGVLAGWIVGLYFSEIFGVNPPRHDDFFRLIIMIIFSAVGGFTGWLIAKIIGRFLSTEYRRVRGMGLSAFGEPGDSRKFFLDINHQYGKSEISYEYVYYLNKISRMRYHGGRPFINYNETPVNEYEKSARLDLDGQGWLILYQKKFVNPWNGLIASISAKKEFKYEFLVPRGGIRRFAFKS